MSYKKLVFYFYVFCILWFFLLDYVIKEQAFEALAVYTNYLIYVFLSFQVILLFGKKSNFFGGKKFYRVFKGTTLLLFAYLFYALLQILINPELSDFSYFRQNYSVVLPSFALALLIGITMRNSKLTMDSVIRAIFVVMGLVIVYSETLGASISGTGVSGDVRAGGIFDQANNYGYFLALFSIICVLNLIGFVRVIKSRPLSIIVYLLTLGLVLKTGSYGSLLVSLLLGLYLSFNYIKKLNIVRLLSFASIVVVLLVSLFAYSASIESNRVRALRSLVIGGSGSDISDESTFALRFTLVNEGLNSFAEAPILGKGLTGRTVSIGGRAIPVHNVFIVELLKGGLLGLIIFLTLYFTIWRKIRRLLKNDTRRVAIALLVYMVLIDNTLTYPSFLSMNSGVIALALIFTLIYNESKVPHLNPAPVRV